MITQESLASFEIDGRLVRHFPLPLASEGAVKNGQHGINRGQNVGFGTPEG